MQPGSRRGGIAENKVLVTGAAGFIGYHTARRLAESGSQVVAIDNMNSYYDVRLKEKRRAELEQFDQLRFIPLELCDRDAVSALFAEHAFPYVIHLAAQAGVRYSITNPHSYIDSNITGFMNVLEACRHNSCRHMVFASSSSVYGANTRLPSSVHDGTSHPISLYAATKKANELVAHSYSHLFGIPTTGVRFFTTYGPWGRPDMALFLFASAIAEGRPIKLYNYGKSRRDFTYIDDVVESLTRLIEHIPVPDRSWSGLAPNPSTSTAPWRVYNIGNSEAIEITRVVELLEAELGRRAIVELLPMQPGDVAETCADTDDLVRDIGFRPNTSIEDGIARFVAWYRDYYGQ